jgi:hypothetical protein
MIDDKIEDKSNISAMALFDEFLHIGNRAIRSIYFFIFSFVRRKILNWKQEKYSFLYHSPVARDQYCTCSGGNGSRLTISSWGESYMGETFGINILRLTALQEECW